MDQIRNPACILEFKYGTYTGPFQRIIKLFKNGYNFWNWNFGHHW